ncbi:MAG: CoA transferase [Chloroflexi bacterium]|nr:CoA transferase [Chloroflexota bacterium]
MPEEALTGLKVLDLSTEYAGPYAAKLLADSGADVIKVEPPAGDVSRRWGPFPGGVPHPEKSGTFLYLNTNKRGITLDLETATGRSLLRPLIEWADIIIESFPVGTMESWGLGYPELEAINPAVVLTSVTPFGQTGPIAQWQATEIIMQAIAGLMNISGAEDREPLKYPLMQGQFAAGANAAGVSMVAFFNRRMTGEGQHVDVSVIETIAGYYFSLLPTYTYTGVVSRRSRTGPGFALSPAKDGLIMTSQAPSGTWDDFAALLDAPELLDPRFATPQERAWRRRWACPGASCRRLMRSRRTPTWKCANTGRKWITPSRATCDSPEGPSK